MRGEDRLSNLPDHILHHIFSFLPTTQLFFTTYSLSNKWRYFWRTFPHLLFNINSHDAEAFVDKFMSRLASNPGPDIQSFRLRWSSHNYKALKCIKKWISTALSRNVAILDIYLGPGLTVFTVPAKVFTAASSSVKVIKLESHFYGHSFTLPIPMLSSPNLKTLELIKIKLPKGDSIREAILGCPVLETLVMKQCHYSHLKVLNLSLNRLKELEIDNSAERFRVTGVGDCKLELHAPNLSTFVYKGVLFNDCSFGNLAALIDVQLFLCPPFVEQHLRFLQGLKGARAVVLEGIEEFIVQMREQILQPTSGQVHEAQLFYSTVSGVGLKRRRVYGLESQQASRSFYNVPWASSSQRLSVRPEDIARLKSKLSLLRNQLQEMQQLKSDVFSQLNTQLQELEHQLMHEHQQPTQEQLLVLLGFCTRFEALSQCLHRRDSSASSSQSSSHLHMVLAPPPSPPPPRPRG